MAVEGITELKYSLKGIFLLVRVLKLVNREVEGGRCMRCCDGMFCFSEEVEFEKVIWKGSQVR